MSLENLTGKVIGAAMEVHRNLGPGLLESTYEKCLVHEFLERGIRFSHQISLPVIYKGKSIDCGYRIDFLIEDALILELKAIDKLLTIHEAQLLTYLKLAERKIGLLLNFNCKFLKSGIKRIAL